MRWQGRTNFCGTGKNAQGTNAAPGLYTIQIVAGAAGYADWTNITDDSAAFEVDSPRGIDVNKNTNSPYCGRVFVGNNGGEQLPGVFMFNADGSAADEGVFGDGGICLGGDGYSPWKIAITPEDQVDVNDWSFINLSRGLIFGFDQRMTEGNISGVLGADNYSTESADLSGPYITGAGTNEQIWMADATTNGSQGILRWNLQSDGTAAFGDPGMQVVAVENSDLTRAPYDVAVTTNGVILTIQRAGDGADPVNRVLCFPAWTNGAPPETQARWAVGAGDFWLANAYGIDVNPAGTLAAVAVRGFGDPSPMGSTNGNVSLFAVADGQLVKRFGGEANHQFTDVAWDRVGNLYALDYTAAVWRAYSPPGTNVATTVAVGRVQALNALERPELRWPVFTNGALGVMLHGQSNVTYRVEVSVDLAGWMSVLTNFDTVADRHLTLPATGDGLDFYRAVVER